MTTAEAFEALKQAIQDDPDYAWGWHCNIAMAVYDATHGRVSGEDANLGAKLFMERCFDVQTAEPSGLKISESSRLTT